MLHPWNISWSSPLWEWMLGVLIVAAGYGAWKLYFRWWRRQEKRKG